MATRRKKKGKKSSFRGKIKSNAAKRKSGSSFGHLRVPSGLSVFVPEPDTKVIMDILAYVVTNKKHLDRDKKTGVGVVGEEWYKSPYRTHGNVGANKDKAVCLATFGEKCPICEHQAKRKKQDADEEEIKSMKTSNRNLYAVRVTSIDGKRIKKPKVQLFDFSDYLFQEELEKQIGDEPDFEIFPDLEEGVSIKVTFGEGSYAGHKYPEPTRFDFVKREKPITSAIEKQIPELDKCLDILTYKELKQLFMEGDIETDEEDDDDEDRPRRKKSTRKRFVADDEDDEDDEDAYEDEDEDDDEDYDEDDDDDEEEDDDDDEEEDDDDDEEEEDDEEDDDDDEEEEEPPRRKKKTTRSKSSRGKKSSKTLKCEYGHKFGRDYDKFDDCDDCEIKRKCKIARKK